MPTHFRAVDSYPEQQDCSIFNPNRTWTKDQLELVRTRQDWVLSVWASVQFWAKIGLQSDPSLDRLNRETKSCIGPGPSQSVKC